MFVILCQSIISGLLIATSSRVQEYQTYIHALALLPKLGPYLLRIERHIFQSSSSTLTISSSPHCPQVYANNSFLGSTFQHIIFEHHVLSSGEEQR